MGWLKPFETGWFESRDGRRLFAVHVGVEYSQVIMASDSDGRIWMLDEAGSFRRGGEKSDEDIVEHLKDCTGWTWKKPNKHAKDIRKCIDVLKLYHQIGQDGQAALKLLATVADRIEKESE